MPLKDLKEKVKDAIHQGKDVISQSKEQAMTKGDKLHKQMAPAFERHNEKMRTKSGATAEDTTTTTTGTSATQDAANAVPSEPQLGGSEDVPSRAAFLGGDAQLKPTDETPSGGVADALGAPPGQASSDFNKSSDFGKSSDFNQSSDFNKTSDFNKSSDFNQPSDFNQSSDFNKSSDFNTMATTTTAERPVSPPHESSRDFLNTGAAAAAGSSSDARVWDPVSTEQSRGVNTDTSFGRDQDVLTRGSSSNIGGSGGAGGAGFRVYGGEGAQQDTDQQQQQGASSGSAAKRFIPDVIGNLTGRSDESRGAGDMQSGSGGEALGRTPLGETVATGGSSSGGGGGGAFMPRESGTAQAEGDPLPFDADLQRVSTSEIAPPSSGVTGGSGSAQQTEQLPYGDSDKLRGGASGDIFGASATGNVAPSEAPAVAAGEVPLLSKTGGASWRDQGNVSHSHQFRDAGGDRSGAQQPGLSAPTEEEMPSSSQQQFGGGSSEQQATSAVVVDPFATASSNLTPSAPAASTGEPPLLAASSEQQQQQQAAPASTEPSLLERVSSVFTRSTK